MVAADLDTCQLLYQSASIANEGLHQLSSELNHCNLRQLLWINRAWLHRVVAL